ncbi:MAG: ERCC4 domain-containing protein [Nitrososphaerota archaeon]|nr:helix-hairpin-helix domain-containing protein [Nitrososphaerales archaeon]MDW8044558.1 ERCC4 domain-containing protein [Nitrososphaerota archaeon]
MKIIADTREPDIMMALLSALGFEVERRVITPGDYIISDECAVERKTVHDFLTSLFQGRLLEQMSRLKDAYVKPILLIEGDIAWELERRKNPHAFWGALLKIQLDMGIPVITTVDVKQSADLLYTLAKRMQKKERSRPCVRHKPKLLSEQDMQRFIVEGLPGVGAELSIRLLKHFKTVRRIFQASEAELKKVDGLGPVKAKRITQLLDMEFKDDSIQKDLKLDSNSI